MELFAEIPSSTVAFAIFPFLESEDLLSFRASCSKGYELVNSEEESEAVWRAALLRDFSLGTDCTKTLRVSETSGGTESIPSVFGYSPSESVFEAASAFASWKHWKKASVRYYQPPEHINESPPRRYLYGPYFLRAAVIWSKIEEWCESPKSQEFGSRVRASFQPGMCYYDWSENLAGSRGLLACQALYSFCGGQRPARDALDNIDALLCGLLGGYCAYNYYSCTAFRRPSRVVTIDDRTFVQIAACTLSPHQGIQKFFGVHVPTGEVHLCWEGQSIPAVNRSQHSDGFDFVLEWLEEFAHRLETQMYCIGRMGTQPDNPETIVLYPQLPPTRSQMAGLQVVSRAVTRGVEVVASAVYTPHATPFGFGYIYSIRIRLLTSEDGDEYVSPSVRGFDTCQLQSRDWHIHNQDSGRTEHVTGDGVIGMYPLLHEGGYRHYEGASSTRSHGGEYVQGTFIYQSCTSPMQGYFRGFLRFTPGSLTSPIDEPFDVVVAPFALDMRPPFLF